MVVVSDATPLMVLAAIGQFDLLHKLYGNVTIPEAVYHEVVIAGAGKPGAVETASARWITTQTVADKTATQQLRLRAGLDAGESEALILAQEIGAKIIILDEKAGRREALALGLNVTGTVGVVLLAKERGHITLVKPILDALLRAGFRLSALTYQTALKQAGE